METGKDSSNKAMGTPGHKVYKVKYVGQKGEVYVMLDGVRVVFRRGEVTELNHHQAGLLKGSNQFTEVN